MPSDRIVWLATENRHKLAEAMAILARFGIAVGKLSQAKIEIQSSNLEAISRFAADNISRTRRGIVAVEDSGLFIEALAGFPGVYSSYAFETIGRDGIVQLLANTNRRGAYFQSSIALSESGRTQRIFTGRVYGRISRREKGRNGFGFDPLFIPKGSTATFGEMSSEEKNRLSHRSRGFRRLAKWYDSHYSNFNPHPSGVLK